MARSLEPGDAELTRLLARVARRRSARRRGLSDPPAGREAVAADATPGTIVSIRELGSTVRMFRVARPPGFSFEAGQHMKLGAPGTGTNSYTIASPPSDPALEFCIELVPGGELTPALFGLRAGDRLVLGPRAKGKFLLSREAALHIMVATVTGIAPFRSMLAEHLDRTSARFVVVHGASYADELPYREELEQLAQEHGDRLSYIPTISRPAQSRNHGWEGRQGRADVVAAGLLAEHVDARGVQVYACGNSGMVAKVEQLGAARGLPVTRETFD